MAALHHVPLNWTAKTLANHRSNTKAALIWFAKEKEVLPHGVALSPVWDRLRAQLTDPSSRYRLLPLMRFCSGIHIEPDAVDEAVIDRYMDHRSRTTTRPSDAASRRILARLWNAGIGNVDGWSTVRLVEPPVKAAEGPAWEDFPDGLRDDVERYLTGLAQIHRNKEGQRRRPCKTSTLTTRKRELMAAARMAVKVGVPIETLTSLRAMIDPDVAEKNLRGYWTDDQDSPTTYTINLGCRFIGIAHAIEGFDQIALRRLGDLQFAMEDTRRRNDGEEPRPDPARAYGWRLVPRREFAGAVDATGPSAAASPPVRAAVMAQIAVAIAILTVAPIRLGNLASIRRGRT